MQFNSVPFDSISCKDWAKLLESAATGKILLGSDSNLRISAAKFLDNEKCEALSLTKIYELTIHKFIQTKVDKPTLDLATRSLSTMISNSQYANTARSAAVSTAKTIGWAASKIPFLGSHLDYVPYASQAEEFLKDVEVAKTETSKELEGLDKCPQDIQNAQSKAEKYVSKFKELVDRLRENPVEKDSAAATLDMIKKESENRVKEDPEMLAQFKADFDRGYCFSIYDPDNPETTHQSHHGRPIQDLSPEMRVNYAGKELNALKAMLSVRPDDKKWLPIIQAVCTQGMVVELVVIKSELEMLNATQPKEVRWKDSKQFTHTFNSDYEARFFVDIHRNPNTKEISGFKLKFNCPFSVYAQSKKDETEIRTKVDSGVNYTCTYDVYFDENEDLQVQLKERHFI